MQVGAFGPQPNGWEGVHGAGLGAGPGGGWRGAAPRRVRGQYLSDKEERAHFALWALLKSPLFIAADLRRVAPSSLAILRSKEASGGGSKGGELFSGCTTGWRCEVATRLHGAWMPDWAACCMPAAEAHMQGVHPALHSCRVPSCHQQVVAINQDTLGVPGDLIWKSGPKEVGG